MFEDLFLYALSGLGTSLLAFYRGLRSMIVKRRIRDIPVSKIRSAAMGLNEIEGRIVPIKTMKSPLTGKECVYFRLEIEQATDSINPPRILAKNVGMGKACMEMREKFLMRDGTGEILVDLKGAEVDIIPSHSCDSGALPREASKLLRKKDKETGDFLGINSRHNYTEYLIKPGDRLFVLGTISRNPKKSFSPRHTENMMLCKGKNDDMFYVSNEPVKKRLAKLGWKTITGVFGGAALIVVFLVLTIICFLLGITSG